MTDIFDTWKEAHTAAVLAARTARDASMPADWGIEAASPYYGKAKDGGAKFRIFRLPKPQNRFGFELRCEVVHAEDPL